MRSDPEMVYKFAYEGYFMELVLCVENNIPFDKEKALKYSLMTPHNEGKAAIYGYLFALTEKKSMGRASIEDLPTEVIHMIARNDDVFTRLRSTSHEFHEMLPMEDTRVREYLISRKISSNHGTQLEKFKILRGYIKYPITHSPDARLMYWYYRTDNSGYPIPDMLYNHQITIAAHTLKEATLLYRILNYLADQYIDFHFDTSYERLQKSDEFDKLFSERKLLPMRTRRYEHRPEIFIFKEPVIFTREKIYEIMNDPWVIRYFAGELNRDEEGNDMEFSIMSNILGIKPKTSFVVEGFASMGPLPPRF
jgi:hypothetical protein